MSLWLCPILVRNLSPLDNSLAVFVTNAVITSPVPRPARRPSDEEQPIYFPGIDAVPSSERRLFITDTLGIFAAFQNLIKISRTRYPEWIHSEQSLIVMQKLRFHKRMLDSRFKPSYEEAPVGEELMEWLNIHFIEPSTEEGDLLSSLKSPWEDETFWPYLTRATLRGLSKACDLQHLVESMVSTRLQNFAAERDFAYACRPLRVEMDQIPEADRYDDFDNWWDRLSDIVGILEGRGEIVQRVREELGADWKEVCAAWGVFVDSRLRRQDLPDVVERVLDDMPPDPTNVEDMVHTTLFAGKPAEALLHASQLDRWLSAHLVDIMEALSLIANGSHDMVNPCAECLHSDPALWRITVDYMYSCGVVGKERGDEVLIRVPLRLNDKNVNQTYFHYGREAARRTVCRIAAQTLVHEKDYGLAVSYCSSAEDWQGLGRVVDRVLEYIIGGNFAQYASDIAPSLQNLNIHHPSSQGVFVHRLMFAIRYSNFQQLPMFRDDVAPKAWWAVMLCDVAVDLLQYRPYLLFSGSGAAELLRSGGDYLDVLTRKIHGGGHKEALERLKTVRLALARYFARSALLSV
ncbi:Nup85 nucleoporin-domain-containing protein [Mycena capillaripes]|nr:Nup85 nucleoporin-domain-containing protein [Mycena capillaripes]